MEGASLGLLRFEGVLSGKEAFATDACVPISRLADCVLESKADADATGLVSPIVGHVGDGNFHLTILFDPNSAAERASAEGLAKGRQPARDRHGGHLHGRAWHRLWQDRLPGGRAWCCGRYHAPYQARARSAQHHESWQYGASVGYRRSPRVYALHRQQELLDVVAAWLARDQAFRRAVCEADASLSGTDNPDNRAFSPTALVPALHDGPVHIWDSLAIGEYLAERHPGMRPADSARAWARSVAAECIRASVYAPQRNGDVHPRARRRAAVVRGAGFQIARVGRHPDRIAASWCGRGLPGAVRSRWPMLSTAPWPFASRPTECSRRAKPGAYLRALLAHRFMREWEGAAVAETDIIEADEPRLLYRDKLHATDRA